VAAIKTALSFTTCQKNTAKKHYIYTYMYTYTIALTH